MPKRKYEPLSGSSKRKNTNKKIRALKKLASEIEKSATLRRDEGLQRKYRQRQKRQRHGCHSAVEENNAADIAKIATNGKNDSIAAAKPLKRKGLCNLRLRR